MSSLKLTLASVLLAGILFQGCQEGCTDKETAKNKGTPKTKVVVHHKQNGGNQKPPVPVVDVVAVRKADLAAKKAKMGEYLAKAAKHSNAVKGSVDFSLLLRPGEVVERFGGNEFLLGEKLMGTADSVVFEGALLKDAKSSNDVVMVYATTCGSKAGSVNSLVQDDLFLRALGYLEHENTSVGQLVPEAYFLSGPSPLPAAQAAPFVKGIESPVNYKSCVGSDYRFLVHEKIGKSLEDLSILSGDLGLGDVVNIVGQVLDNLRVIHEYGVVVGNLNWKTVHISFENNEPRVVFTDFTKANFGNGPAMASSDEFSSPAQLKETNRVPTFGDDIYRVYELAGALLGGPGFYERLSQEHAASEGSILDSVKSLGPDRAARSELEKLKRTAHWLVPQSEQERINQESALNVAADQFHREVHEADPNAVPNHQLLLALLDQLRSAI